MGTCTRLAVFVDETPSIYAWQLRIKASVALRISIDVFISPVCTCLQACVCMYVYMSLVSMHINIVIIIIAINLAASALISIILLMATTLGECPKWLPPPSLEVKENQKS